MGSSSILQNAIFKLPSPRSLWFGDLFGICLTIGMFLTGPSDPSCSLLYTADTSTTSCIHLCGFLLSTEILSVPIPSFLPLLPSPIPFHPLLSVPSSTFPSLSTDPSLSTNVCWSSSVSSLGPGQLPPSQPGGDTDDKQPGEEVNIIRSLLLFVVLLQPDR